MKVTWIWRSLAFMFLGMSLGVILSTLVFIHNIPPGTEISVGKVKLKGRDHIIENIISTEDIITESKKEARQRKKREKR